MYPFSVNVAIVGNRVVLTDAQGMTLYYLKNEWSPMTRCTGTCATVWPPAVAPAGASFDPALTPLMVVNTANGPQLAYHGHLLYRYSKDTAPGMVSGDGVVDMWGAWGAVMPGIAWNLSTGGAGY
jgi:predicted lipoprotein with Yx(FWY)xxD motif